MAYIKIIKDRVIRTLLGKNAIPTGLFELSQYFRHNDPIKFSYMYKDGLIIAKSENLRIGNITTSGRTQDDVDQNIKDAILTAFSIPSSYAKEARIVKQGQEENCYALA